MTVIDTLVVELGLDSQDLEKKAPVSVAALKRLEDEASKTEKSVGKVSKASKDTSRSVQDLTRTITGFLGVIGGTMAIKAFVADFIDVNAQIDRLSKNLGVSVSNISAWGNASERLGGSAAGLQGTFDMLSKAQTQLMLTGESSLIPYFSQLGVSLADVNGKARPVTDILLDLSDRFSRMDRTTANNMGRMMGIDQGTLNLLLQGRKELELEIARQKERLALTKQETAQAQKFQTQLADLTQSANKFGRSLLMDAAPAIEKALNLLQSFVDWAQKNKEFIEDFLKVLAVGLGAVALATLPIDLTVVAVIALAAAIALLWQDYQTWKRGGDSLIDWGKWEPAIQAAIKGVKMLGEAIQGLFGNKSAADNFVQQMKDLLENTFDLEKIRKFFWFASQGAKELALISRGDFAGAALLAMQEPPTGKVFGDKTAATAAGNAATGSATPKQTGAQAMMLAQQVSMATGIPAALIYAQWQHETGDFTNRGARELNNYAGINVPGGKGQDYRKFDSPEEFAMYYAKLISTRYPDALKATNADDYAKALKAGGYYSAPESDYAAGMTRFLNQDKNNGYAQALLGVPGAAGVAANAPTGSGAAPQSVDKSVQVQISQMDVNTRATDAPGIAQDFWRSLDYLLTSQANYGLVP